MRYIFGDQTKYPRLFSYLVFPCMQFLILLALQLILFTPMVFIFANSAPLYPSAPLAMISSGIAAVITLAAAYFAFRKLNLREKLSYALSLSFAVFPPCLVRIVGLSMHFRLSSAVLPYEWGQYAKVVTELYSIPFIVFSVLLISLLKLSAYLKKKRQQI